MLKKIILAGLLVLSTAFAAQAEKIYDNWGRYKGQIDEGGKISDEWGRNKGRIDADGRIYDEWSRYKGRVTKD